MAASGTRERVRFSLDLTPEMNELLEEMVEDLGASNKSEVLRKAIALMKVATDAKEQGHTLYIADSPPPGASREIVGI